MKLFDDIILCFIQLPWEFLRYFRPGDEFLNLYFQIYFERVFGV